MGRSKVVDGVQNNTKKRMGTTIDRRDIDIYCGKRDEDRDGGHKPIAQRSKQVGERRVEGETYCK